MNRRDTAYRRQRLRDGARARRAVCAEQVEHNAPVRGALLERARQRRLRRRDKGTAAGAAGAAEARVETQLAPHLVVPLTKVGGQRQSDRNGARGEE